MNVDDQLNSSLIKGFIDKETAGSTLDPKFIINKPEENKYFLNTLQNEVSTCDNFFFSVAFVTQSGLNAIKTQLADLALKGIKGRLLTSTYLGFNHPDVFENLLKIPNLEVRISDEKGFHSKGYLFQHQNYRSFIVGSSNLTMNALKINYEWNVYLTSKEHGEIISQIENHLEQEWDKAKVLDELWITKYRKDYQALKVVNDRDLVAEETPRYLTGIIEPNKMQKVALSSLKDMRDKKYQKALVISATGTGKTYLAAFDVQQAKPKKMLFIVHREQILKKARESFHQILGGPSSDFGILSGNSKDLDAKYLFATIQTISKDNYLQSFAKDYFDYILIDEVHKAGATSYEKVIGYFDPNFMLGMTATPERTDGKNIYELFDYHIAYEIRLQEAMNEDLLCPFNYFGITEFEANGQVDRNTKNLANFISEDRVKYIIEKINYYGCDHNDPKGLIFCGNKLEAKELAKKFNDHHIPSAALTGDDSIPERERVVDLLEKGRLNYIFTVDIFNEGIDIPKINQIVMLRYTESSIIFIQQLGRGLRKDPSKSFVTVIDFIGDYQNNYMIPMALAGDNLRNKNSLRKNTFSTNYITGLSSVSFEEIAKERIFKAIDSAKLNSMAELKRVYTELKQKLNRIPYLIDFQKFDAIDPEVLAYKQGSGFDSYYSFLKKMGDAEGEISLNDEKLLSFFGRELLAGQRVHEIVILNLLTKFKKSLSFDDIKLELEKMNLPSDDTWINSTIKTLNVSFYAGGMAKTYKDSGLVVQDGQSIDLSENLRSALENSYFVKLWNDLLTVGYIKSEKYNQSQNLTIYKKYKRRDTLRLLHWSEQLVDQNIGGYTYNKDLKKFVIFMTVDKGEKFKGAEMAYEDKILNDQKILYFTKAKRRLTSPEVQILKDSKDWDIYIFAKKSDDEGTDFYNLGEVEPIVNTIAEHEKLTQKGEKQSVVSLELKLKNRIDTDLYNYLVSFI